MPLWNKVRSGTLQNTVMDWFFDNYEGTTSDLATFLYRESDVYTRNRIGSVLRALELKGLISNIPRARWRINAVPKEIASPEMQEHRIQLLEARLIALEIRAGVKRTGRDE